MSVNILFFLQENAELQLDSIEQRRQEHRERYTNLRKALAERGLRKVRYVIQ